MSFIPRRRKDFDFIGRKWLWFAISGALMLISIVALIVQGLNFGVDFTGGTELTIKVKPGTEISEVRDATSSLGYNDAQIQSTTRDTFIIRVPKLDEKEKVELEAALKEKAGLIETSTNDVGPGWGGQVSRQAIIALAVFLGAVLLYVSIRFEFKMAVVSIVEVAHDCLVTVGIYALTGREVTPATVIAVLTILGYSLYDTMVVFDRVKENDEMLTRSTRKTYSMVVNESINQVLMRSVNTSLMSLVPILSILLFGGSVLNSFAYPMFIGVVIGGYSSIILAPPLVAMWKETEPKYRAYKEQAERRTARGSKAPAEVADGKATPRSKAKATGPQAAATQKKAPARKKPQPAAAAKAVPKPKAPVPEPQREPVKPKPKSAAAKAPSGKSSSQAKSRTKGPGSGKKKKKKR